MYEYDLLSPNSFIYENPEPIDCIHQSYIDLKGYSKEDVSSCEELLNNAITYLDRDIKDDFANDLFSLILKCFSIYSSELPHIFESILKNREKNANYVIITASILSYMIHTHLLINDYKSFVSNALDDIFPQIIKSNENVLFVFKHKISNNFKSSLIFDLLLSSNLTEGLITNFLPFITSNIKTNLSQFSLLLSDLVKKGLIKLIDPSIFMDKEIYSCISDEIFAQFLPDLSKELFERLFSQIYETFLSSSKLSSIFVINFIQKCQEFDIKNLEIENVFKFLSSSEFSPQICEYIKKYDDFFITDEIAPNFFNLTDHELLFKIVKNLNALPENLLNECLLKFKSIQVYIRCFVDNEYNACNPILNSREFLIHFYSVIENSESNDDICKVFARLIENENFIEIIDEIIFSFSFKDEKKSQIFTTVIESLSDNYEKKFYELEHMKKIVLKILETRKIPNFIFIEILSAETFNNLYQENPEYIKDPLFLYGYHFSTIRKNDSKIELPKLTILKVKNYLNESFIKFISTNDFSYLSELTDDLLLLSMCPLLLIEQNSIEIEGLTEETILPCFSIFYKNYEKKEDMGSLFWDQDILEKILTNEYKDVIKKSIELFYNNNCTELLVALINSILGNNSLYFQLNDEYAELKDQIFSLLFDFLSEKDMKIDYTKIIDNLIAYLKSPVQKNVIDYIFDKLNKCDYKLISNKIDSDIFPLQKFKNILITDNSTSNEVINSIILLRKLCQNPEKIECTNDNLNFLIKNLTNAYRTAIKEGRKDEALIVADLMIENEFLIEFDNVFEEFLPFDVKNPILEDNIDDLLSYILSSENLEKNDLPIQILYKKMMNETSNSVRHYEIVFETFLNRSQINIKDILEFYLFDFLRYEDSFLNAINHSFVVSPHDECLINKYEFCHLADSPYSKVGHLIIKKLFEKKENFNAFLCLKSIACTFIFLFEKDPQRIFDFVLPHLDNYHLVFEKDLNKTNLEKVKIAYSSLSFLASVLQSNIVIDAFINWFFANLYDFGDSQLVCFLMILLQIIENLQTEPILMSYLLKYDFYSKLSFLLSKNFINEKLNNHYYKVLYSLIKATLIISNDDIETILIDECKRKEVFFKEKFKNLFILYPCQLKRLLPEDLDMNEELHNFINDFDKIRPFWFNYKEKKFDIDSQHISKFVDSYKQRNKTLKDFEVYNFTKTDLTKVDSVRYCSVFPFWIYSQFTASYRNIDLIKGHDQLILDLNEKIKEINSKDNLPPINFDGKNYFKQIFENSSLFDTIFQKIFKVSKFFGTQEIKEIFKILINDEILTIQSFLMKIFQFIDLNNDKITAESLRSIIFLFSDYVDETSFREAFLKNYSNKLIYLILQPHFRDNVKLLNSAYTIFSKFEVDLLSMSFTHVIAFMILTNDKDLIKKGLTLYNKYDYKKLDHLLIIKDIFDIELNKENPSIDIIHNYITLVPYIANEWKNELIEYLSYLLKKGENLNDPSFIEKFISIFNLLTPSRDNKQIFSMSDSLVKLMRPEGSKIQIPDNIWNLRPNFWTFYLQNASYIEKINENSDLYSQKIKLFDEFPEFVEFKIRFDNFTKKMTNSINSSTIFAFTVDPDNIFYSSYDEIFLKGNDRWMDTFLVKYVNNIGSDSGGITRDWMTKMAQELINPKNHLFISCDKDMSFQPDPDSKYLINNYENYYKFAGKFIARCIIQGVGVNIHFTRTFLKQILHRQMNFSDLESAYDDQYRSLKYYLDNDIDNDPSNEFYFEIEWEINGERKTIQLKENGSDIKVTDSNKREYADLMANFYLDKLIHENVSAFVEGFNSLIPHEEIKRFTPNELNLIICGAPKIDLKDFRENIDCLNENVLNMFFNVISKWNDEDLAKLLMFITGTSKIPPAGFRFFKDVGYQITIDVSDDTDNLPVAHTCFNLLSLPKYEDEETMDQKLRYAINNCDSFHMV
ncbi:hypothetical protein M9Y10_031522 [Tritrichomonas musculus]|uniref:HECT-type E3 ubiquitin transferase n=1 Tax=Tritrichomonas musculus TaxID=1915356 RepID=A0ABR2GJG1_9EUKA